MWTVLKWAGPLDCGHKVAKTENDGQSILEPTYFFECGAKGKVRMFNVVEPRNKCQRCVDAIVERSKRQD